MSLARRELEEIILLDDYVERRDRLKEWVADWIVTPQTEMTVDRRVLISASKPEVKRTLAVALARAMREFIENVCLGARSQGILDVTEMNVSEGMRYTLTMNIVRRERRKGTPAPPKKALDTSDTSGL